MPKSGSRIGEIRRLAGCEVRPETPETCLAPVEFVDYEPAAANVELSAR